MAEKTVQVQVSMQSTCRKILKQYAALRGETMSDILYRAAKYEIHRAAVSDPRVAGMIEREEKCIDHEFLTKSEERWSEKDMS